MKKIDEMALNHRDSAKKVDVTELQNTGVNRDTFRFVKGDEISFPEELSVWMDTFTPSGSKEVKEYYLVTVMVNDKPFDITMASMRRSRQIVDEDLPKIFESEVCRSLHQAGDDEQRAVYLAGRKLKVIEIIASKSRFDETQKVYVPIFQEI